MARYYFHTEDGEPVRDEDGTELPSDIAARNEAVKVMGELLREDPDGFWAHASFKLTVTDTRGLVLYILDLSGVTSPVVRPGSQP